MYIIIYKKYKIFNSCYKVLIYYINNWIDIFTKIGRSLMSNGSFEYELLKLLIVYLLQKASMSSLNFTSSPLIKCVQHIKLIATIMRCNNYQSHSMRSLLPKGDSVI